MNNTVTLKKMVISLADLKKLSDKDKKRFLMLTNTLRDLNLLQKMMLFSQEDNNSSIHQAAVVTTNFFFLKVLMSKIFELWVFITDEEYLKNKRSLSVVTCQELSYLEQFFSEKKKCEIFEFVRNKFGFHYALDDYIQQKINDAMTHEGDYEMWLGTTSGNDVFSSSNTIMLRVIFDEMKKLGFQGGDEQLFKELLNITLDVARIARAFCVNHVTQDILKDLALEEKESVTISAPLLNEVRLPFIVRNN